MKIGLMGLTFNSGNKGCEALSYSFLETLNWIGKKEKIQVTAVLIEVFPTKQWIKNCFNRTRLSKKYLPAADFTNVNSEYIFYKRIGNRFFFEPGLKDCDCIFDFTYGDSFTDIYGEERFNKGSSLKKEIIRRKIPLILGSQTIGPFRNKNHEKTAVEIIHGAKEVYVRDQMSFDYTVKISGRRPLITTDVAFLLPYEEQGRTQGKLKVGFNASGLLWNGGYTRNNQFGLEVNYQEYCRQVIKAFLLNGREVHLILHAFSKDLTRPDNDLTAALALHNEFPETILSPEFITPMEAKGYISKMDVFIGARMHATIGALSAGIPVIPFSYSRKFEGLFHSLNYKWLIHGCEEKTDTAVEKTLCWCGNLNQLHADLEVCKELVREKTDFLLESYKTVILEEC